MIDHLSSQKHAKENTVICHTSIMLQINLLINIYWQVYYGGLQQIMPGFEKINTLQPQ